MITREQFLEYERVRQSGITNMFDIRIVSYLTGLGREELLEIMKEYTTLKEKYINEKWPYYTYI